MFNLLCLFPTGYQLNSQDCNFLPGFELLLFFFFESQNILSTRRSEAVVPRYFIKKPILKNLVKFLGKHFKTSLFNKALGLQFSTSLGTDIFLWILLYFSVKLLEAASVRYYFYHEVSTIFQISISRNKCPTSLSGIWYCCFVSNTANTYCVKPEMESYNFLKPRS